MVDRARPPCSSIEIRRRAQGDAGGRVPSRRVAPHRLVDARRAQTHHRLEEHVGRRRVAHRDLDAVEPEDCRARAGRSPRRVMCDLHQFERESLWIREAHHAPSVADGGTLHGDAFAREAAIPRLARVAADREPDDGGVPSSGAALAFLRPHEERQQRAGPSRVVAVVQVAGPLVLEVDRALDEA